MDSIKSACNSLVTYLSSSSTPSPIPTAQFVAQFLRGNDPKSSKELIALLKTDTEIARLYRLFAGVGEGYRVEEHTEMVLDSFNKEFANDPEVKNILERSHLTAEEFSLFLALHDIAKGKAVEEIDLHSAPTREEYARLFEIRKGLELRYNREEIKRVCEAWNLMGLHPVFDALLIDDSIGDLMKTMLVTPADFEKAASSMKEGAAASHMDVESFMNLKILFHKIDAASYPFVRYKFFQHSKTQQVTLCHETVMKYVGYSQANLDKVSELRTSLGLVEVSSPVAASSSMPPELEPFQFLKV